MLAQHDRHVANARDVAAHTPNDVRFSVQVALSFGVEFGVVCHIVVAFRQELGRARRYPATA